MLTELVPVPAGSFRMGSTSFYPEEAPIHTATVNAFGIERHPVTNAQFAEFVDATGYVTVAERAVDTAPPTCVLRIHRSGSFQFLLRQLKLPNATFVISLVLDVAERVARTAREARAHQAGNSRSHDPGERTVMHDVRQHGNTQIQS